MALREDVHSRIRVTVVTRTTEGIEVPSLSEEGTMTRPVKFTFRKGLRTEELEGRIGFIVRRHRAHGATDAELGQFLSRDVEYEGLIVADPPGGQPEAPEYEPVLLHVRRR